MTLLKNPIKKSKTKKISFDNYVKVTLIPSISDYKEVSIYKDLWFSQLDIKTIMNKTFIEISDYQKKLGIETYKEAYKRYLEEEMKIFE